MPNGNQAFGLKPVRRTHGGVSNFATREYFVPASDATALFIGDPVIMAGSADADGTTPSVARVTTGRVTGVVVGFRPSDSIVANGYRLASTAAYVLVSDDPDTLFEIQGNASIAAVDIGLNADLVAGSGSAVTHKSGYQLDLSTKAVTATLQCRIMGIQPRADNDLTANAKILVRINLTTETGAAGSLGV
jgi:hypothetical protein